MTRGSSAHTRERLAVLETKWHSLWAPHEQEVRELRKQVENLTFYAKIISRVGLAMMVHGGVDYLRMLGDALNGLL